MNKKADGRASSLFFIGAIVTTIMILFSSMMLDLSIDYGVDNIEQFSGYDSIRNDTFDDIDQLNKLINTSSGQLQEGQGIEDLSYTKPVKIINKMPEYMKLTSKLIYNIAVDLGNFIPDEVLLFIFVSMTFLIVVLVARALLRYQGV